MLEDQVAEKVDSVEIQWSVYAEHYDNMCAANPSYQSMLTLVVDRFAQLPKCGSARVADIGAGTGNLLAQLATQYQSTEFTHVDMDHGMNKWARAKYAALGTNNVQIVESPFLEWDSEDGGYDIILSTNALYAIQPHREALAKMRRLLSRDGYLILVDFGRKQNTNDWAWYIAKNSLKEHGIRTTAKIFLENWEVARQNRRTKEAQESGLYWLHGTDEFAEEIESCGFTVEDISQCYRGYSDIAVCKKSC